jgi:hypothetical protein
MGTPQGGGTRFVPSHMHVGGVGVNHMVEMKADPNQLSAVAEACLARHAGPGVVNVTIGIIGP